MTVLIILLRGFAVVWAVVAVLFVLVGMIGILIGDGFGALAATSFNIANFIVMIITFAPAIGAYMLADRLESGTWSG